MPTTVKKSKTSKSPKSVWCRSENVLWRRNGPDTVIIIKSDELAMAYTLDALAARAWELMDGRKTDQEIVDLLGSKTNYSTSSLRQSLSALTKELKSKNLIHKG